MRAFCVSCFSSLKKAILNWCLTNKSCKTQRVYIIHKHPNIPCYLQRDTSGNFRGLHYRALDLKQVTVQLFPNNSVYSSPWHSSDLSIDLIYSKPVTLAQGRGFGTPQNLYANRADCGLELTTWIPASKRAKLAITTEHNVSERIWKAKVKNWNQVQLWVQNI